MIYITVFKLRTYECANSINAKSESNDFITEEHNAKTENYERNGYRRRF